MGRRGAVSSSLSAACANAAVEVKEPIYGTNWANWDAIFAFRAVRHRGLRADVPYYPRSRLEPCAMT